MGLVRVAVGALDAESLSARVAEVIMSDGTRTACIQRFGSNGVGQGWSHGNALVGEFGTTFLLVFTVLRTTANSDFDYSSMACFSISLAVFLGHSLLIPIDVPHQSSQIFRSSCCPQLTVNIALAMPPK